MYVPETVCCRVRGGLLYGRHGWDWRWRDGAVAEDDRPDDQPHVLLGPVPKQDPLRPPAALRSQLCVDERIQISSELGMHLIQIMRKPT